MRKSYCNWHELKLQVDSESRLVSCLGDDPKLMPTSLYKTFIFSALCIIALYSFLHPSKHSSIQYGNVTLIIPLTAKYLRGNCVDNVLYYYLHGTLVPKQVILVVSEVNMTDPYYAENFDRLTEEWQLDGLNLTILEREGQFTAGSNKNYGLKIRSQPIITFFDVDDVPHPQRIEQIVSFFERDQTLDVFLHGFLKMDKASFPYFLIKVKTNEFEKLTSQYTYTSDQLRPSYAK